MLSFREMSASSTESSNDPIENLNSALENAGSDIRVESFSDIRNIPLMDAIADFNGELMEAKEFDKVEAITNAKHAFSKHAKQAIRAARKLKA